MRMTLYGQSYKGVFTYLTESIPASETVLTLDQQLYCKAKELQWANAETCQKLVVRLGSFHIALNFMKVIGQHFADSGLVDVWIESTVYGDNTAQNNMAAKSYNRTVRAHKLTYEALWRILWDKFVKWAEDSSVDINPDIMGAAKSVANEMSGKSSADAVHDQVNKLEEIFADTDMSGMLKEFEKDRSPSFTYWRQYMELVSLLLQFIRAERTAN